MPNYPPKWMLHLPAEVILGGADVWSHTLLQDDVPVLPQVGFGQLDVAELQIVMAKLMTWAGFGAVQGVLCVIDHDEMTPQLQMVLQTVQELVQMPLRVAVIHPARSKIGAHPMVTAVRAHPKMRRARGSTPAADGRRFCCMHNTEKLMAYCEMVERCRLGMQNSMDHSRLQEAAAAAMPRAYATLARAGAPMRKIEKILIECGKRKLEATFRYELPAGDRKRRLGTVYSRPMHRQDKAARWARTSATQMKSSALPPLVPVEMEPGDTLRDLLTMPHPFALPAPLDQPTIDIFTKMARDPEHMNSSRKRSLRYWMKRAYDLAPESIRLIKNHPDVHIRRLLLKNKMDIEDDQRDFGDSVHILWLKEITKAAGCADASYWNDFWRGMPILGPIQKSGRWQDLDETPKLTIEEITSRAWEIRKEVIAKARGDTKAQGAKEIWKATMSDVERGHSIGPFWTEADVSKELGCEDWICAYRFPVHQKNKIRGCDDYCRNMGNDTSARSEKLEVTSTDENVARIKELRRIQQEAKDDDGNPDPAGLRAWILDEKDAYRQIPVRPDHRKFSVIVVRHPDGGDKVAFFVMIGHSFGLISAVYNYNRRSAILNEILNKIFEVPACFYYDDKFGIETEDTIMTADECVVNLHRIAGCDYDNEKRYVGRHPTILGVTYDLVAMLLQIKESRKEELIGIIEGIKRSERLTPGEAAKIKGKLGFAASHFWGKIGRCFMRCLSERQYCRSFRSDLNDAIKICLDEWMKIIKEVKPRSIDYAGGEDVDAVIYTDGYFPDHRKQEKDEPRIGAVMFVKDQRIPIATTIEVPKAIVDLWIPRKTQISMVEAIAVPIAAHTFRDQIKGKRILWMLDSESVFGSIVKGYSDREDICSVSAITWEIMRRCEAEVYFERIPTDGNLSDSPSRGSLRLAAELGWAMVPAEIPASLQVGDVQGLGEI
ncbi:MAG: hypothetical protein VX252_05305 [Myxococcota bacterium]|nr:hypothetical protein [Myxococcota bacterium]